MNTKNNPTIVLIGRPNVGKSKLFNRLTGSRKAIVNDYSGLTRDRNYGKMTIAEREFVIVDTGGLAHDDESELADYIQNQALVAAKEAHLILFVVDGKEGYCEYDRELFQQLTRIQKETLVLVNKIDCTEHETRAHEFYELGTEQLFPVSAEHGLGISELEDVILEKIPSTMKFTKDYDLSLALVGRPNVGKSSILNRLLNDERNIVSPISGTTRDSIDSYLQYFNQRIRIIDTAGIRQKSKVRNDAEFYSVRRSIKSIEECDIAILVLDATEGVTEQDTKIVSTVLESGKALLLAINKWDLIEKRDSKEADNFIKDIKHRLRFLEAPHCLVSAKENLRINKLLKFIPELHSQYTKKVTTSKLNQTLNEILEKHPPPSHSKAKYKPIRFYYCTQVSIEPPTFVFFANKPDAIHFSYKRYLRNQIQKTFGMESVPVRLIFRSKNNTLEKNV